MDRPVPVRTLLTISAEYDGKATDFVCTVLGYGRYGMQLSLPQLLNRIYSLPSATKIKCSFISVSTNQLLSFDSYVMGYERTEPPCMVVAVPDTLQTSNRRDALRYVTTLPLDYVAEGDEAFGEHTETVDLSLTGLKMVTHRVLAKGTVLSVTLHLPTDSVMLTGIVAWASYRGRRATAGVRFLRVRSSVQASLAKYLNSLEREWRKPGVLL